MERSVYSKIYPGLLIVLSLVSWLTTGGGIFNWLHESLGFVPAIALALAMSGFVQIAIAAFWFGVTAEAIPVLLKPLCLALAIGLSVVSGGLAAGSWLMIMSQGKFEDALDQQSFQAVSGPLIAFSDSLRDVERAMDQVSQLSLEKETTEAERGASCDGPAVEPGHGPRARMRQRLAGEAQSQAATARALAGAALDVATLPAGINQAALGEAFTNARSLARDRRIEDMRLWAADTSAAFQNGFTDPSTGATFTCRDAAMQLKLASLSASLAQDISLPDTPPIAADLDFSVAMRHAYGQIFALLGASPAAEDAAFTAAAQDSFRVPLSIAAFVELTIILLIILTTALKRGPRRIGGMGPGTGRPLEPEDAKETQSTIDLLDALVLDEGCNAYFLIPEDGDPRLRAKARDLALRWALPLAAGGEAIHLYDISPAHQSVLAARDAAAKHYSVHLFPQRKRAWWAQAARDLAATRAATVA